MTETYDKVKSSFKKHLFFWSNYMQAGKRYNCRSFARYGW